MSAIRTNPIFTHEENYKADESLILSLDDDKKNDNNETYSVGFSIGMDMYKKYFMLKLKPGSMDRSKCFKDLYEYGYLEGQYRNIENKCGEWIFDFSTYEKPYYVKIIMKKKCIKKNDWYSMFEGLDEDDRHVWEY